MNSTKGCPNLSILTKWRCYGCQLNKFRRCSRNASHSLLPSAFSLQGLCQLPCVELIVALLSYVAIIDCSIIFLFSILLPGLSCRIVSADCMIAEDIIRHCSR